MPVIKPVLTATASAPVASGGAVTTTLNPDTTRYFATLTAGMLGATTTTIPAGSFVDDADAAITALPALTANDYFNVYINGVLQQQSLSTLSTSDLVLNATTPDLSAGTPIQLEIVSFANVSSTLSTPPTISAPIITITS
ncbi:DUF4183 domain-containing protein [Paenibacillus motobuensis]|uniref:DUF4183 domain-containing protein n=1 Tax=Paenibacillus TaxID=44249 RepID=UPI00203F3737|nr:MULTISPECIES: DUF4183 domain-containing protein [Paenibacillus]MCM3039917.1 DUF4183 domain-containing protein [Paenibacillus lutimineralis]MCM3647021.1 DUF4183 domain-containing protein [Paenibacillus motobuensis]